MTEYRRANVPGATWFFTVNLAERRGNHLLVDQIDTLQRSFRYSRKSVHFVWMRWWSCRIIFHCIWTLPPGDTDFSMRWNLLKGHFSRAIEKANDSLKAGQNDENGACGNVDFGSTCYEIRRVSTRRALVSMPRCAAPPISARNSNTYADTLPVRLLLTNAGQVVLTLKTPYRDGTTHIVMSALELMQRLAALVPRPRLHLIRFHGVLAQNKLNHFPYIDQYCLDHGLLEHRIETTSEVVSILIG